MYAHVSGSTSGSTLTSKYEPEAEGKVEGVVYELFLCDANCGKVQCFQHEINK